MSVENLLYSAVKGATVLSPPINTGVGIAFKIKGDLEGQPIIAPYLFVGNEFSDNISSVSNYIPIILGGKSFTFSTGNNVLIFGFAGIYRFFSTQPLVADIEISYSRGVYGGGSSSAGTIDPLPKPIPTIGVLTLNNGNLLYFNNGNSVELNV